MILVAIGLLTSLNIHAQVYDLLRRISNESGTIVDTFHIANMQTGTMEIIGNTVTRRFTTCLPNNPCTKKTFNDEIIFANEISAQLTGDSGDLVVIDILALNPRLVLFYSMDDIFTIDEYVLRQ